MNTPEDQRLQAGAAITFRKWGGHPHWAATGALPLGEDGHGRWYAIPPGTIFRRPGAEFASHGIQVLLVPRGERWCVVTFYEPVAGYQWRLYTDIATPPEADATGVRCVDLDLDVTQSFDGLVQVEDEDEFAAHRVRYGYPPEVVRGALAECDRVVRELGEGHPMFAEATVAPWRARAAAALARR